MIRDEYSDEVGDLWDAFSKALKTSGRDWIKVKTPRQNELSRYLAAQQKSGFASNQRLYPYFDQPHQRMITHTFHENPPTGLLGGVFGSLGL